MNEHAAFYKRNGVAINMVHTYYAYDPLPLMMRIVRRLHAWSRTR